jgi:hypothetical protein
MAEKTTRSPLRRQFAPLDFLNRGIIFNFESRYELHQSFNYPNFNDRRISRARERRFRAATTG